MEINQETSETSFQSLQKDTYSREKIFLAEQSSEGGLKVLPGDKWAFHYPHGSESKRTTIFNLLDGKGKPEDVVENLKPDVLIFDANDLKDQSLNSVIGKVRDISAYVNNYDYLRFARFASEMQGTGTNPEEVQSLYDGITQNRIRKQMIEAYGFTGREQIKEALKLDSEKTIQQINNLPKLEKILSALKLNWLNEDLQIIKSGQRDQVVSQLSKEEHNLYEQLKDSYHDYVKKGDQTGYDNLVKGIKENIADANDNFKKTPKDESQEKLEEELEKYIDKTVPPVTPGDPAIPPDDHDEYHTPSTQPGESKEQSSTRPFFEITPSGDSKKPLIGYYASGRKSYYDIERKTWSKKKQLSSYNSNFSGVERQTISGIIDSGLKSLPLPNGYGIDSASLKFGGSQPEILRDQNGCFYIKAEGISKFSLDFLKEEPIFSGSPVAEDIVPIHRGQLSLETEKIMVNLSGDSLSKSEAVRQYLFSKHFYPGDGDLKMAQALQLKLRSESTGNNYIQNLDQSEYLECYSANTLFVAMLRKLGIPSRLVVGHRIEKAKEGKAVIDGGTGHAWSEVWDGSRWRRMDATPRAKNPKKDQDQQQNFPTKEAEDEGIEKQTQGEQQNQSQEGRSGQMAEASDQDVAKSESQLNNAKQFSKEMDQKKLNMNQKVENAQSFNDLKNLKKEAQDVDLFEDMKKELEQRIESKEEQMKELIRENLDEMEQDGFLDEEKRQEIEKQIKEGQLEELDRVEKQIEKESSLFNEYQGIKEEVMPLVDQWFDYFAERLPKQEEIGQDEDSLTRQGSFNRHSVMKPRNLLFGTVKNPRIIESSIKPKFLASILVDVSGSMQGEKLKMARKQLIFYNELFSKIGEEFGFIRYANNIFSDNISEIKAYDQDYESPVRYDWGNGDHSTIKARLMQSLRSTGGTDMLPAINKAAIDLNKETFEYPDFASAFYFIGDGEDTSGNAEKIKEFLRLSREEGGFGDHMLSAIMLGDKSQKEELASIFGDEHTAVAPDFETLIEESMYKFDEDIESYLANKTS